jgi:hypothetical protein
MTLTSSGSLAAIARQMRWFAWSLGVPLDPRSTAVPQGIATALARPQRANGRAGS